MNTRTVARFGLMTGVMLVLGYVESLLPAFGAPGIKLGLSNTVLLYALLLSGPKEAVFLAGMKVLLSGFLFGAPSAMLYSAAGAAVSLLVMVPVSRLRGVSPVGVSAAGAVFHNIGQCAVAVLFVKVQAVLVYLPVLLISGVITGIITGITAKYLIRHIKKK